MTVFCADCGTEAGLMTGREAGLREPHLADARVWACPLCEGSWAAHDEASGGAVAAPAGPETRNARERTRFDQVERLITEALDACPGARAIAEDRIGGFLAHALGLERADAAIGQLTINQCREAYRVLRAASYADVVRHAQTYRGVKGRAA